MLKFYLEIGLVVTGIHKFIEFYPETCFKDLTQEIVKTRRKKDRDPNLQVVAHTNKLIKMLKFLKNFNFLFLNYFIGQFALEFLFAQ